LLVFRNQFHALKNHRLHLAVGPDNGPPLVLLHGVLRAWNDWSPMLDAFAMRWKVIGVDLRGHGNSDRTPGEYRVADFVGDAVQLARDLVEQPSRGEPITIIGHSLGAMVALAVAAEVPTLVRGVVAEDPPFHTMGERIGQSPLADYFRGLRDVHARAQAHDSGIADLAHMLAELPVRAAGGPSTQRLGDLRDAVALRFFAACLKHVDRSVFEPIVAGQWLEGFDVADVLKRIRCPVLLMQADATAGGMLADADAAIAERAIAECYRERFPGIGHAIHAADTAGMTRRTVAFLESLRVGEINAAPRGSDDGLLSEMASGKSHRIDGHETRSRHDSHQARPVG
jgi:pimeloyl-ACP methyl ester carboxylesterase